MRRLALLPLLFLFSACLDEAATGALAQQTANEFNLNTRFGRMAMASDNVAPAYREEFNRKHLDWGQNVRIADSEFAGMKLATKESAVVAIKVSWSRVDEGELKLTTVRQNWKNIKGTWMLDHEELMAGDLGLLGEHVEVLAPETPRAAAQFPTVRIGASD
jgi:hypothetical protein